MKPEDIHLSDVQRILFGEVPAGFFIELIFRALIIYLVLIISIRLMGKKMSSQMGRNELAATVSLAAAVGIPLMNADKGILPGIIIAAVIIFFQIMISRRVARNAKFEKLAEGTMSVLIKDGVMDLKKMKHTRITRERLFAQLRSQQKTHLGTVKRLYLESNGLFTVLDNNEPRAGLLILPDWDKKFIDEMTTKTGEYVCGNCGNLKNENSQQDKCCNCGADDWLEAVI